MHQIILFVITISSPSTTLNSVLGALFISFIVVVANCAIPNRNWQTNMITSVENYLFDELWRASWNYYCKLTYTHSHPQTGSKWNTAYLLKMKKVDIFHNFTHSHNSSSSSSDSNNNNDNDNKKPYTHMAYTLYIQIENDQCNDVAVDSNRDLFINIA